MRKLLSSFLLLVFLVVAFSSCKTIHSDARINSTSETPQPTVDNSANTKTIVADDDQNSPECVRSKPEPIINKEVFPRTAFRLEKNKKYPFEYLGYETVEFENGDRLLIENTGCENYTLVFRFETSRFSGKTNDAKFWYEKSAELIGQVIDGIREPNTINDQVKALNSYIEKDDPLKFNEEIEVAGEGIKENVRLGKIKKLKNKKVEIVLSFNTGPL